MKKRNLFLLFLAQTTLSLPAHAGPPAQAYVDYDRYVAVLEARLAARHRSTQGFLAFDGNASAAIARLRRGEILIVRESAPQPRGAMLHHWRATAFVAGAKAADFLSFMQDYDHLAGAYAPQVVASHLVLRKGNDYKISMRLRQHKVITVVLDADYWVHYGRLDAAHGYSLARSTRTTEIEHAGERNERTLPPGEAQGFLARSNTYWSYVETPEGLIMQCESLSLTRDAPPGLGWAVRPFVASIPQETLQFTLDATRKALQTRRMHGR